MTDNRLSGYREKKSLVKEIFEKTLEGRGLQYQVADQDTLRSISKAYGKPVGSDVLLVDVVVDHGDVGKIYVNDGSAGERVYALSHAIWELLTERPNKDEGESEHVAIEYGAGEILSEIAEERDDQVGQFASDGFKVWYECNSKGEDDLSRKVMSLYDNGITPDMVEFRPAGYGAKLRTETDGGKSKPLISYAWNAPLGIVGYFGTFFGNLLRGCEPLPPGKKGLTESLSDDLTNWYLNRPTEVDKLKKEAEMLEQRVRIKELRGKLRTP